MGKHGREALRSVSMYGERINKCHLIRAADFDEWIDNNNNNKTKTEQTYDDRDRNS